MVEYEKIRKKLLPHRGRKVRLTAGRQQLCEIFKQPDDCRTGQKRDERGRKERAEQALGHSGALLEK